MYIRVSANCRKIRSSVSTSRLGKKIYSFRGVRYAEPPTETALFSGKFFSFFSSLDYNSINSGKIPGAWTFVKLIVNLQLCGNKGNLPCFLFTYEYLSGGTFIRVGIILAIFPQIAIPAANWNDVFDVSNEGPGCLNLDQMGLKSKDCLRLNVYTGKVFFLSYLNRCILIEQHIFTHNYKLLFFSIIVFTIDIIPNYINFCTRVFETLIITRYSNQYKH